MSRHQGKKNFHVHVSFFLACSLVLALTMTALVFTFTRHHVVPVILLLASVPFFGRAVYLLWFRKEKKHVN